MTARALLTAAYALLVEVNGEDAVDEMLNPPTLAERHEMRLAELRAVGVI